MGRIGVDFEQVKTAAEALLAAGEAPTIERVRRVVGQGSFSTLARHLKSWRLTQKTGTSAPEPMPDAITEAAQGLWLGLSEAARSELENFREASEQALAAHADEAESAQKRLISERDDARQDRDLARGQIEKLESFIAEKEAQISQEQHESRELLAEKEAQLREAKARVQSLDAQLSAQRDQLEHAQSGRQAAEALSEQSRQDYLNHLAAFRREADREKEAAATRQGQQDKQIHALISTLERGDKRLEALAAEQKQSEKALSSARDAVGTAQHQIVVLEKACQKSNEMAQIWQQKAEERAVAWEQNERRRHDLEQRLQEAERHNHAASDHTARMLRAIEALEQKVDREKPFTKRD